MPLDRLEWDTLLSRSMFFNRGIMHLHPPKVMKNASVHPPFMEAFQDLQFRDMFSTEQN